MRSNAEPAPASAAASAALSHRLGPVAGIGKLGVTVWPTHAGAVDERGVEPLSHRDYQRGQIDWGKNEQGRIVGNVKIEVPPGNWTHIVYSHHPSSPMFITAQKLSHPFNLPQGGAIRLLDITDEDVRPFSRDRALHD
jgi:hypothetical protein